MPEEPIVHPANPPQVPPVPNTESSVPTAPDSAATRPAPAVQSSPQPPAAPAVAPKPEPIPVSPPVPSTAASVPAAPDSAAPGPAPAIQGSPRPPAAPAVTSTPETVPISTIDEHALETAIQAEAEVSAENLYTFGLSQTDRARLIAQSQLFSQFIQMNVPRFVTIPVKRFLDIGCGEGQLTIVLSKVYPDAHGFGLDKDPQAVTAAQKKVPNIFGRHGTLEFVTGDIEETLPAGPFDLIYASVVFSYLRQPQKTLKLIYDALAPGGWIWIKEVEIKSFQQALDDPLYQRFIQLTYDSFKKVSPHPFLEEELPTMLVEAGFSDISRVKESYEMSNNSLAGRIALSNILGAFYNLRKAITMIAGIPEEDYLKMHRELSAKANTLKGNITYTNLVARRPLA